MSLDADLPISSKHRKHESTSSASSSDCNDEGLSFLKKKPNGTNNTPLVGILANRRLSSSDIRDGLSDLRDESNSKQNLGKNINFSEEINYEHSGTQRTNISELPEALDRQLSLEISNVDERYALQRRLSNTSSEGQLEKDSSPDSALETSSLDEIGDESSDIDDDDDGDGDEKNSDEGDRSEDLEDTNDSVSDSDSQKNLTQEFNGLSEISRTSKPANLSIEVQSATRELKTNICLEADRKPLTSTLSTPDTDGKRRKMDITENLLMEKSEPIVEDYRTLQTIVRRNRSGLKKQSSRIRNYMICIDLSPESIYALEWTVGTVLRDGDLLYLVYAIECVDLDRRSVVQLKEERAIYLKQIVDKLHILLRRTRLQCTCGIELIHHKVVRHLITEMVFNLLNFVNQLTFTD